MHDAPAAGVPGLCSACIQTCDHTRTLAYPVSARSLQVGPTMRTASAALAAIRPAQLTAGQPYTITARARDAFDNDLAAAVPYPGFMLGAEFSAALAEPPLVDQFGDGATVITYRINRPGEYALQVGAGSRGWALAAGLPAVGAAGLHAVPSVLCHLCIHCQHCQCLVSMHAGQSGTSSAHRYPPMLHTWPQVYTEAYATACSLNSSACARELVYQGALAIQPGPLHPPHTLASFSASRLAAGELLTFSLAARDVLNNSVAWDQLPAQDYEVRLRLLLLSCELLRAAASCCELL